MSLFYVSHKIYAGKPGLAGLPATFGDENACETLELFCEDPVLGLKVTLLYTAFSDVDVITRSVRIENDGDVISDKRHCPSPWIWITVILHCLRCTVPGREAYVRTPQSKKEGLWVWNP